MGEDVASNSQMPRRWRQTDFPVPLDPWLVPPLTTVRQPLTDMGAAAARMVLDLAFGAELPSKRRELGTELVVRSSTAVPAR